MISKLTLNNLQEELPNAAIVLDQRENQAEEMAAKWMSGDQRQYLGDDTSSMVMADKNISNSLAAYRGLDVDESWMLQGQTNDMHMPLWTAHELPTPNWGHHQQVNYTCDSKREGGEKKGTIAHLVNDVHDSNKQVDPVKRVRKST